MDMKRGTNEMGSNAELKGLFGEQGIFETLSKMSLLGCVWRS